MGWSDSLEADVIHSGADGFVRKTFRPSELVAAVLADDPRRRTRIRSDAA